VLLSLPLCFLALYVKRGGKKRLTSTYNRYFKKSSLAVPLAVGGSVFLGSILYCFYFSKHFLYKVSSLKEDGLGKPLEPQKKNVLLPSVEKDLDPGLNSKGNEADRLDLSPSFKNENFEENGKGGGAQKVSKNRSFVFKLIFLGLIFIALLITVLYFTCSKGENNIENKDSLDGEKVGEEKDSIVLSKENIEDIWKTKYLGKIKEQKDLSSLAKNLFTVSSFIKSIFLDFFKVNLSKEQTKSIYLEAFSSLKGICSSKSYRLEFAIKKKEVVWYFGFYFLVSENDVKVYCGMKNVESTVNWFNKISADHRFKTLNSGVGAYTILYTYSEMPEQGVEKLKEFLKDKNLTYFLYEGEES